MTKILNSQDLFKQPSLELAEFRLLCSVQKINNMKNKNLIKKLYRHFDEMEFCVFTDDEFYFLWVHHGLSIIFIEKNCFNISFEVNCEATPAAIITQEIIQFASKHKMKLNIYETYADVTNEEGVIQETLFGEEAIHYHETGELPIKKEIPSKENQEDKVDVEKKVDNILDQISFKGMKSLNKKQKQFLENYSKGKQEHKH